MILIEKMWVIVVIGTVGSYDQTLRSWRKYWSKSLMAVIDEGRCKWLKLFALKTPKNLGNVFYTAFALFWTIILCI